MQPASSSNTAPGSNSSTSAEEREAAANNPPQRKRRRMATGHGVQQIPETSTILLPPKEQEQRTLRPVEQRHVAEHQPAATVSFTGAEPTEIDRSDPTAAFAEASAADEPMVTEAGPAAEEIPLDIIANFLPCHQEEIRQHLNDEDVQQILNEVRNFLTLLRESGIKLSPGRGRIPTPTLFSRLSKLSVTKDAETIRKFFVKATIFFSAVNPAQTKNTGCLSTMLDSNTHITNFANETEDNLRLLAGNPYLKQITSMCNRKGVPDPVQAAEIIEWDCWKIDGKFSFDLLRTFSSMSHGRGLIKQAEVERVLAWPCWQVNGKFSLDLLRIFSSMSSSRGLLKDEARINAVLAWECWKIEGEFSIELLRTVASMLSGRGLPEKEPTEKLLSWPCWQVDGKFSFELLRSFSSMSHGRGLIKQAEVEQVLAWPCWQVNGKFSHDLLRIFSSMVSGRGLLKDEARITAMLAWDCWKIDGKFSIELMRIFSSMMNGCGIPQKEKVEAILAWPCWQVNGKFSFELLRTFSSMSSGRGLIKQAEVERVLAWPCWQVNGKFSLDLLRIFSSMSSSRGLLKDEARINAILAWKCWKIDGEFSIELLRAVASMLSSRGLPEKEPTENFLSWPCWQIDGKFSLDLFRIFSAMHHSRGLSKNQEDIAAILIWPCWRANGKFSFELLRSFSSMMIGKGLFNRAKVEAILAWPCWQLNGEFNLELFRIFSSMAHGRGLFKRAQVEKVLAWPCWQVNGEFSIELLHIFSSMMNGRGVLDDQARITAILAWDCWKIDGKFSFILLRTFSSMMNGRGLLEKVPIEEMLAWPCWQVDGKFSLRLMRVFSSMMTGQGIPEQADVEALLAWPCWQVDGKVSIDRLHMFAAMNHGRGMPDQATAEAFLAWLPLRTQTSDKGQMYLRSACRAFVRTRVLDPKVLTDIEAALCPYFTEDITSDDGHSSDNEDEQSEMGQLKALTLFCAASAKWQRNLSEIQKFLAACNTTSRSQTVVHRIMDSLLQILANHGQAGVRLWLEHHSRQPDSKGRLSAALSIFAPLALAKFALKQLPESEWQDYIALCKNLLPTPDKEQWQALKPLRYLLNKRFSFTLRKRTMLEILWSLSDDNHPRYREKINALLKIVPTTVQLIRLQQAFGQKKMQTFLDACLTWQNAVQQSANSAVVPEPKIQELLLEGLLVANHYLSDHGPIPELCFSKQSAGSNGQSVIIDGEAAVTGQQRLWHFIAAMLIELEQTEYQFKRQQLRISPQDSKPIVLPKPEFTAANTGFVITNWSLEQLTAFFRATEFTEHWYKNPDDTRDICVIRSEQRLLQTRARPQNITQTGYKAGHNSFRSLLSPSVIINIIKQGIRLKPAVWSSLEHYAKNGQLSDTLCRLLAPIIKKELASTTPDAIPEIVKKTVAERLRQTVTSQTAAVVKATQSPSSSGALATAADASTIISPSQMLPASLDTAIDMALDTMARDMAIEGLEHFPVLGSAELDMLEPWRDQMTYPQLMNVITKIDLQSEEPETVTAWQETYENRRRDNLGLDLDEFLDALLEGADD